MEPAPEITVVQPPLPPPTLAPELAGHTGPLDLPPEAQGYWTGYRILRMTIFLFCIVLQAIITIWALIVGGPAGFALLKTVPLMIGGAIALAIIAVIHRRTSVPAQTNTSSPSHAPSSREQLVRTLKRGGFTLLGLYLIFVTIIAAQLFGANIPYGLPIIGIFGVYILPLFGLLGLMGAISSGVALWHTDKKLMGWLILLFLAPRLIDPIVYGVFNLLAF